MVIVNELEKEMVTIEVDTRDSMIAKTLEMDSEMEIKMMDLFEDLSLEDIVANKACVGKMMGCKNMVASVSEADCTFVMNKRPWLVNGVLLNLKPWPIEGEVRLSKFELARFWVEFHGLPTCCLSENNVPLLAKKVGQLVKSDGKSKEETVRCGFLRCWVDVWLSHPIPVGFFLKSGSIPEVWVQFKYEKLPYLCFNCGMLAHINKDCSAPTAWVTPPKGAAVRMYGPWIKVEGPSGSCFSTATYRREIVQCNEGAKLNGVGQRTRGNWKRRPLAFRKEVGEGSSQALADHDRSKKKEDGRPEMLVVDTQSCTMHGVVHGTRRQWIAKDDDVAIGEGRKVVPSGNDARGECLNIPPKSVLTELPTPDFANVDQGNDMGILPVIGPSLIQSLNIPHIWSCKSQMPHYFPEPINFKWPTNDPELQKLYWSKKRKAHQWYQPIPDKLKESPFEEEVHETGTIATATIEDKLTDADGKEIAVETFKLGTSGVWTTDPRCGAIIKEAWNKPYSGQAGIRVCKKLRETKVALKEWNRNVFGFCDQQLKRLYARLSILQTQQMFSPKVKAEEKALIHGILNMKFKDINMALLAKLAWYMLDGENSSKPWVKILNAKYCKVQDFWSVQEKQDDSKVWRGILANRDLCIKNAGFLVGDGKIDIWTKPWVPRYSPEECFTPEVAEAIVRIRPLFGSGDTLFWQGSSKGTFSVKSAYWCAQNHRFQTEKQVWKDLWKRKIHARQKILLWRILSGCLPLKNRLGYVQESDKICGLCGLEPENDVHLFRDCHFARCLWFASPWGFLNGNLAHLAMQEQPHLLRSQTEFGQFDKTSAAEVQGV
ncbi:hypothetical protein F8388_021949 [Cannabis sativa]|uniref:CCHC-type domain-containing protein n=1 Tax=Cannabis sativa TaxID=3483 RepID=A0A7J6DWK5_CANSA|nr:hypothetical protein G4B88_022910 [Cannabis sativa]KAF4349839.1 hypothetical protein F8388_021949 [Cannabis sativa]